MIARHTSWLVVAGFVLTANAAQAQSASGAFTGKEGRIAVAHATAYSVRDQRNARNTETEILLSDVAVNAADIQTAFDPHMIAINLDALDDRNYILLWVGADGGVSMNATYSKTMTQYMNDTRGELKVEWKTRSADRLEGRLFTTAPAKTMNGATYTVDVTFAVTLPKAAAGQPLSADGGEPGKALVAFLAAARNKNWNAIKAGSSPDALTMFDKSYNTPQENAESAADLVKAWISTDKMRITGGQLQGDVAMLDVEGDMFPGQRTLSRVRMVRSAGAGGTGGAGSTAGVWKFDRATRAGFVR